MPHIHNKPGQHDYTVGAYIIKLDNNEPKALLHMHSKMRMLFPIGGHIELEETPWQAVIREIREESGFLVDQLKILQPKDRIKYLSDVVAHPQPVVLSDQDVSSEHFHTDIAFAFLVQEEPLGEIDEGESEDLRWMSQTQINKLMIADIFPNTREIYNYIFSECLPNWEKVSPKEYEI